MNDTIKISRELLELALSNVLQGPPLDRIVKAKQELPFTLLSDTQEQLCTQFGVIKEKKLYGKPVRGIERSTFVIDRNGVLRREWRGVKAEGHAREVLDFVKTL